MQPSADPVRPSRDPDLPPTPSAMDPVPDPPRRPQSPASRGLRAGLLLALVATFVALTANDSWLLPALDGTGVEVLLSATSVAEGGEAVVAVAPWDAPEATRPPGPRAAALAGGVATLVRRGVRPHVAGLWVLAGALVLLVVALGWAVGGGAGFEAGLLGGALLLASPLGVHAVTTLRPELPAAALVALVVGSQAYRPRWYLLHGTVAAAAWALHPAGAGAVAAAALWPWALRRGIPGVRRAGGGDGRGRTALGSAGALLPAAVLLVLGPTVDGLPSLPAVVGAEPSLDPLLGTLRWAGAGLGGAVGALLGAAVLATGAALAVGIGAGAEPVDAEVAWDHPRAPELVAARARIAAGLAVLGTAVAGAAAGATEALEAPAVLVAAPAAVLLALVAARAIAGARPPARWVAVGVVAVWLLVSGGRAVATAGALRADGRGFTSGAWVQSETVRWLDNRLPRGLALYASEPRLVLIQTALPARGLPASGSSLEAFGAHLRRVPGALVLTGPDTARADELERALGLATAHRGERGRILLPAALPASPPGPAAP